MQKEVGERKQKRGTEPESNLDNFKYSFSRSNVSQEQMLYFQSLFSKFNSTFVN